jgi:hypothetical protein
MEFLLFIFIVFSIGNFFLSLGAGVLKDDKAEYFSALYYLFASFSGIKYWLLILGS